MAQSSHTGIAPMDAEAACNLNFMMSWITMNAYTKRAMAPTIIERDSAAAYDFPSARMVSPRVASATEGAAAKRPAKLLGFRQSPGTANSDTMRPPTMNRKMNSMSWNSAPYPRAAMDDVAPAKDGRLRSYSPWC